MNSPGIREEDTRKISGWEEKILGDYVRTCSTPNVDVKGTFLLMLSLHNIVFQLQFHHIFFTVQNPVTYCSNKNSQHKIYVV